MKNYNELELALENIKGNVIYVSKDFYKSIKKTKKEIELEYNVKIKRR